MSSFTCFILCLVWKYPLGRWCVAYDLSYYTLLNPIWIDNMGYIIGRRGYSQNACVHDDVIKWKHFPRYWPFVRRIHRSPVNSPHKAQWRGALMFSLIYARINGWVNNREAGDLRRHQAHCDVIVMSSCCSCTICDYLFSSNALEILQSCSKPSVKRAETKLSVFCQTATLIYASWAIFYIASLKGLMDRVGQILLRGSWFNCELDSKALCS